MKLYRVYKSYHESDCSGTVEFGCYSSIEQAEKRISEVWKNRNYPEPKPEDKSTSGWSVDDGWDFISIKIVEMEVDKDIEKDCYGYT